MRTGPAWLSRVIVSVALTLALAGGAWAQTTTVETRNFELISVDGNKLVVRDERGTQELTVPSDFRFTIDGKSLAVSDLKAGMKGTATITTTTTIKPVVVTEVREGQVLRASDVSVTVRLADGSTRRFTQGELDKRDIQIFKDGKPIRVADLRRGDPLTATIVTNAAPVVLTEQEVQATLADTKAEAAPTQMAAAGGTAQPASPAANPPASAAPPSAPQPASKSADSSGSATMWYVAIAVLIALALFFFLRRRKEP